MHQHPAHRSVSGKEKELVWENIFFFPLSLNPREPLPQHHQQPRILLLGAQHTFLRTASLLLPWIKKAAEPEDTCCILSILHHPPQAARAAWLLPAAGAAQKAY